jgi:hypothetical protein
LHSDHASDGRLEAPMPAANTPSLAQVRLPMPSRLSGRAGSYTGRLLRQHSGMDRKQNAV